LTMRYLPRRTEGKGGGDPTNLRKADWMIDRLRQSGRELQSPRERVIENRRRERLRQHPKQNRPLSDCIKDGNVIDQEVNDCVNGLIEPTWK